jgi:hypothetical protein
MGRKVIEMFLEPLEFGLNGIFLGLNNGHYAGEKLGNTILFFKQSSLNLRASQAKRFVDETIIYHAIILCYL